MSKPSILDMTDEEFAKRFPVPVKGETKADRSLCVYPGCMTKHAGNGSSYRCETHEDGDMSKPEWMCSFNQCNGEVVKGTYYCDEHPNGEDNEFDIELFRCHKCRCVNHEDSGKTVIDEEEFCSVCVPLTDEK